MKALFGIIDYDIILDSGAGELKELLSSKIQTRLQDYSSGKDLDKILSLELANTKNPDGIDILFLPDKAKNFKDIKHVNVTISNIVYGLLETRGEAITAYFDNKIRILYRKPQIPII